MTRRRKVFRIEEMRSRRERADASATLVPQQRILAELAALRRLMEHRSVGTSRHDPVTEGGDEIKGLRRLRSETDGIQRAIDRTKREIAALHANALNAPATGCAARELGAVISGGERAIQQILAAAEEIDEAANTLSAALKQEQERALAHDIRDQVVRIFEASNFQDLASQRIGKVLSTLEFIGTRISRMIEIWGGIEAFRDHTAAAQSDLRHGSPPLSGPMLDGDPGHASQAEVDVLFGSE
jgi:chemotaxis protein CheZ